MRHSRRHSGSVGFGGVRGRVAVVAAIGGLSVALPAAIPNEAWACGGLFCNSPPPDPFAPLPVAQNGENIVFSITPDPAGGAPTLVAHIQIFYTGDAAKFSWVVPVESPPDLSVGTDRLFTALASATQPRFQTSQVTDGTCIVPPPGTSGSGGSAASGSGGASSSGGSTGAGGASGSVTVTFQGAVGPFDAAVIKSDDSTMLKKWLTDNGYTVSDAAAALIDAYVAEQKAFVALKLLNGVGVQSIQPIVLTFRGTEPCVPLRLTAIAANPDMPVLLWVLGDHRVVPKGFYEIKIDEARIDWLGAGSNYFGPTGLVSLAANEVGGQAFVAEYAGPSTIARGAVYTNGQFNLAALQAAMTPPTYVQQLITMGLANDPQMLPLLDKYIPMPQAVKDMGVTDSQFYGNLAGYWNTVAFPPFDLAGLTDAISTTIIQPRIDAQMMIDEHPYLTRLNTFISPEEMDRDPLFLVNAELGTVSNVHQATLRTMCGNREFLQCNAPVKLELADGRAAWVRPGSTATTCSYRPYDASGLKSLPATEVAWQRELTGEGARVVDNTDLIRTGLDANNARFPTEQGRFPIGSTGGAGGAGGDGVGGKGAGGTGGTAGLGGTGARGGTAGFRGTSSGGAPGSGGGTIYPGARGGGGGGCACAVEGEGSRSAAGMFALGSIAWLLRRRRGRPRQ